MAGDMQQQKDLVLNPNEYAYLLDRTKGIVNCYVGPTKTSLSNTDAPVVFNPKTKRFEECYLEEAIHLFVTAPENWYIVLKNPDPKGNHPQPRAVNELPSLQIGKKVNITGPVSFALYPGQMARTIQGHRLRSNQYLLVRVYDEESARENWNSSVIKVKENANNQDTEPETAEVEVPEGASSITDVSSNDLTVGKIMVIKGTEVSFYIPPTGIEVVPINDKEYVRDAVTLERLEYCILKDEDGNKRYVHGPAVVFPEPTESFIESANGYKFRAIELSKISGIYIKVIAEYDDEHGKHHNVGEEMFITGKEQMIYYPRPEHAIITYGNRILHHAVAIPAGEGRYVMNRMTGEITTVKGPSMFLPDPRTQVIVKRKLTRSQAALWYPGNKEVIAYNESLNEPTMDASYAFCASADAHESGAKSMITPADLDLGGLMNRNTTYTPPRTITIDNKFEGVVSIDVWTGYAINVISKDGTRKVVVGPCTYLMGYDETLEILEMSTGKPKTTDNLIRTTFLRVDNNKIGDIINLETKDFVGVEAKVSYCVDFLKDYMDKWFSVENYVKYLCDRLRSLLKREVKNYTIEEFYQHSSDIIRKMVLNLPAPNEEIPDCAVPMGRLFTENGMLVHDVEVLSVKVDENVAYLLESHQSEMIKKAIELSDADQRAAVAKRLSDANRAIIDLAHADKLYQLTINAESDKKEMEYKAQAQANQALLVQDKLKADQAQQALKDAIAAAELTRAEKEHASEVDYRTKLAELEKSRREAYADAMAKIMGAISPQLAASIQNLSEQSYFSGIAQSLSPLAIVGDTSIAEVASKLMKNTVFEDIMSTFQSAQNLPRPAEEE